MKLVKNSDITLTVDGNGVPSKVFEPVGPSKMCFALKVTAFVAFNAKHILLGPTGSKTLLGTPLPSTVSVISLFLTSFMVT